MFVRYVPLVNHNAPSAILGLCMRCHLARAVFSAVGSRAMRALLLPPGLVLDARIETDAGVQGGIEIRPGERAEGRCLGCGFSGPGALGRPGCGGLGMSAARNGRGDSLALEDGKSRDNLAQTVGGLVIGRLGESEREEAGEGEDGHAFWGGSVWLGGVGWCGYVGGVV